jgi:hypothetical protein
MGEKTQDTMRLTGCSLVAANSLHFVLRPARLIDKDSWQSDEKTLL